MKEESYNKHLVDYFRKNISKGYTPDSLKWALVNQGYSRIEITRAIDEFNKELARKAPILKEKPAIKYEIVDENNKPLPLKKSFLKKLFGLK